MTNQNKAVGGQKAMCCFSQLFACALAKSVGIYFLLILTYCNMVFVAILGNELYYVLTTVLFVRWQFETKNLIK